MDNRIGGFLPSANLYTSMFENSETPNSREIKTYTEACDLQSLNEEKEVLPHLENNHNQHIVEKTNTIATTLQNVKIENPKDSKLSKVTQECSKKRGRGEIEKEAHAIVLQDDSESKFPQDSFKDKKACMISSISDSSEKISTFGNITHLSHDICASMLLNGTYDLIRGRTENAKGLFEQIIQSNPDCYAASAARIHIITCLRKMDKKQELQELVKSFALFFVEKLKKDSTFQTAFYFGRFLIEIGQFQKAKPILEKCSQKPEMFQQKHVELNPISLGLPTQGVIHTWYGILLIKLGEHEQAVKQLRIGVDLEKTHFCLGWLAEALQVNSLYELGLLLAVPYFPDLIEFKEKDYIYTPSIMRKEEEAFRNLIEFESSEDPQSDDSDGQPGCNFF